MTAGDGCVASSVSEHASEFSWDSRKNRNPLTRNGEFLPVMLLELEARPVAFDVSPLCDFAFASPSRLVNGKEATLPLPFGPLRQLWTTT